MYKLGIDVGGTNTDAVIINQRREVVAEVKHPTTDDVYEGILCAIRKVLEISGVDRKEIRQTMLGTTQCTNAIVERKHLAKVGLIRIGAPATTGIPPMVDWPEDIQAVVEDYVVIRGGFEFDGKELAPLDVEAARAFLERMKGKVQSIAIVSVFSTIRNDHELTIAHLCREVMGEDIHISISSEIGSMGLIERENATILNAALHRVAQQLTEGFAKSLAEEGISNAEVYLSQNDGTLMTMEHARRYPHPHHCLRPHQLHPRRVVSQPGKRRHRDRCGRHYHRSGRYSERVPPGVQRGGHHRRRPHQLPDAGHHLHRPGRRLHHPTGAKRADYRGTGQRGLPDHLGCPRLRREDRDRHGYRREVGDDGAWRSRAGSGH